VGPRVGLDAVENRKILHCREANPGHPARSPSLYRLSYPDSNRIWKIEVKRPIERTMLRCEDIIKVGLEEVE
jgi:hypothetical protein